MSEFQRQYAGFNSIFRVQRVSGTVQGISGAFRGLSDTFQGISEDFHRVSEALREFLGVFRKIS